MNISSHRWGLGLSIALCCAGLVLAAENTTRVEGRVTKKGTGVAAVVVLINELKLTADTDAHGRFAFSKVPRGSYTVILTLGNDTAVHRLDVSEGGTTQVEFEVDWETRGYEEVTVIADVLATKVVDAPAAVTSIDDKEVAEVASTGQAPKALEFTPGAEVTQSGLYDFNFNTRGFNSSLNRRISTYIDGRDVGVVLLGAQEWASISGGLDDVAKLEFIRGPSAALYGANASSGVVNITTKAPRDSLGGFVRATAGELNTRGINIRDAFKLGDGWYGKVMAGFNDSGDYTVSRNPDVELHPEYSDYCLLIGHVNCLPAEKSLFIAQDDEIRFAALRFDKYLSDRSLLTFESGISTIKGPVFQTGIGRVQDLDSKRPFYRFNWSSEHWNVLGHYSSRDGNQVNLAKALVVDYELMTQEKRYGVEFQGNWKFDRGRGRFVIGAAATEEHVNTVDPSTGEQTVIWEPVSTNREAIFTQVDWSPDPHVKLVFAGREDWSTLHSPYFSPKAAVVYNIDQANSIRLTYNRAFQVANYSEFFLHTSISSFPIGGFVRTICASPVLAHPVDCGIQGDFIPILAVGNNDLKLEETEAWELGYSGLLAKKVFMTVDYYRSKNKNFITDLVPQVGTILGNLDGCVDPNGNPETNPKRCPINNDYLGWVGPQEAETTYLYGTLTVAQALRNAVDNSVGGNTLGFRLAQDLNGDPVVVGRTYTNVGEVNTQGVDLGLQYFITPGLSLQASYSWFDFTVINSGSALGNLEALLLPNSPEHKGSLALSLSRNRWMFSVAGRWVKGFPWSAGVFQGYVDDYTTCDLAVGYRFNDTIAGGLNISNAANNVHRQTFGGDLLSRRALLNVTVTW